ncbi:MAG: FliH/SctL family protein [Geminicoccaceae bacterium]
MPEPFRKIRDLGHAQILYENHSPRWHAPDRLEKKQRPQWREIRQQGRGPVEETTEQIAEPVDIAGLDLLFGEGEVARMCAAAAARARATAVAGEEEKAQARLATLAGDIARVAATAEEARTAFAERAAGQLSRLLVSAIHALVPDERSRPYTDEVLQFVRQCIARLENPDELRIEMAPELVDAAGEGIRRIARDLKVRAKIRINGSDALEPGQVRVSWKDGWAENDPGLVERIVRENLTLLVGETAMRDAAEAARAFDETAEAPSATPISEQVAEHTDDVPASMEQAAADSAAADEEEP